MAELKGSGRGPRLPGLALAKLLAGGTNGSSGAPDRTVSPLRILVFANSFAPAVRTGGPARSITNLVDAVSPQHEVVVVAPDRDMGDAQPFTGLVGEGPVRRGSAVVHYVNLSSRRHYWSLLAELSSVDYDLIVLNSVWNLKMAFVPAVLRELGILRGATVLMPRGELEPSALAHKQFKKKPLAAVVKFVYRRSIDVFGSTSASEKQNLARWFPSTPIVQTANLPEAIDFGRPSSSSDALRLIFVGRIHPVKGLLPLLEALTQVRSQFVLDIYGPLESTKYWQQCQEVIASLPTNVTASYRGVLPRAELAGALWNADCSVLLTGGENFGHIIAESLQAGCPVIATAATPWTSTLLGGGGSVITNRDDHEQVAAVLEGWARKSPDELAASRQTAREAVDLHLTDQGPNIVEAAVRAIR